MNTASSPSLNQAARAKQAIRERVWALLERERVARFPGATGRIPNFAGAPGHHWYRRLTQSPDGLVSGSPQSVGQCQRGGGEQQTARTDAGDGAGGDVGRKCHNERRRRHKAQQRAQRHQQPIAKNRCERKEM